MKFALSEDQRIIQDTAENFLSQYSDTNTTRVVMESDKEWQPELWQRICTEMGWQSMHIPEEYGGLGLSYSSLAVVIEQTGSFLLNAPLFSSTCMASNALLRARALGSTASAISTSLTDLAAGKVTATLGWMGTDSLSYDMQQSVLHASSKKDDYILDGVVAHVLHGASADLLIVAAYADKRDKTGSVVLLLVPAQSDGVECVATPTIDQTRPKATIRFRNVHVPKTHVLADVHIGAEALSQSLRLAGVALAAEQAGVARRCLDMSVRYACERKQFGVPIGTFQSIQHQCADMFLKVESMRSSAWYAACAAQEYLEEALAQPQFVEIAAIAQSYCSEHCFSCASDNIQIHGGVGFTWEFDPHLYFKRAQSNETLLGDSTVHQEALAGIILDT